MSLRGCSHMGDAAFLRVNKLQTKPSIVGHTPLRPSMLRVSVCVCVCMRAHVCVQAAQSCFLFSVYCVSLKATVAAWTPVSHYSVGSTSDVVLWLCSGFFLKNTVWKRNSHKYVQNGFWPESLCVLTKGCCKLESGMQRFRLWDPSCLFFRVLPQTLQR